MKHFVRKIISDFRLVIFTDERNFSNAISTDVRFLLVMFVMFHEFITSDIFDYLHVYQYVCDNMYDVDESQITKC